MYFSKRNYRLLSYLYGKNDVTEKRLMDKFGKCFKEKKNKKDDGRGAVFWTLAALVKQGYAGCELEDGTFTSFEEIPYSTSNKAKYFLLSKGEFYVENRRWGRWKWIVPLLISAISLLFSFYNLFFS